MNEFDEGYMELIQMLPSVKTAQKKLVDYISIQFNLNYRFQLSGLMCAVKQFKILLFKKVLKVFIKRFLIDNSCLDLNCSEEIEEIKLVLDNIVENC